MLTKDQVDTYLKTAKEIGESYKLMDMHVHPFEVIYYGLKYVPNSEVAGLYSTNVSRYVPSETALLKEDEASEAKYRQMAPDLRAKFSLFSFRRLYAHTGPALFREQMRLGGIGKSLLLPVMSPDESDESQMERMTEMFGHDERFALGYCVPNSVPVDGITGAVRAAIQKYNVRAIKIHPNITGIDLTASSGKQRVEAILEASRETGLAVIVHGGRSPDVKDPKAVGYSTLQNLGSIDWGITGAPVVIAHAGIFGHEASEIETDILPLLDRLLANYDHLIVDVSALNIQGLGSVLNRVDLSRMVFGSDALYHLQWRAVVKLMYALEKTVINYEEAFVQIASVNPEKYILSEHRNLASHPLEEGQ